MKSKMFIQFTVYILLFVLNYTTASKLLNFSHYRRSMLSQPFADWVASILIFFVPLIEIVAVILLLRPGWRSKGLFASTLLMSAFTMYVLYVYISGLNKRVCPCGGLFSQLNWSQHLIVNSSLTLISLIAYLLYRNKINLFHGREKKGKADAPD